MATKAFSSAVAPDGAVRNPHTDTEELRGGLSRSPQYSYLPQEPLSVHLISNSTSKEVGGGLLDDKLNGPVLLELLGTVVVVQPDRALGSKD